MAKTKPQRAPRTQIKFRRAQHPSLYEINTRVWVRELGRKSRKKTFTLADIPDRVLNEIADLHFDLVWLMGIWQTGERGRTIARRFESEYRRVLPDLASRDILSSPYAVQEYQVSSDLGGLKALARLHRRLAQRGVGLILDFVPNHTACDHPWVFFHPEYYVNGDEETLLRDPQKFFRAETASGDKIIAHGRDPYFPPWSDTAQLDCRHPGMRAAMKDRLMEIATRCDGVRCDMAMLVLKDVFSRTWGERAGSEEVQAPENEFWTEAIDAVRKRFPDFIFIAEAYWGLERELQALGFDYTYDKILCDRLLHNGTPEVREHLSTHAEVLPSSVHFLENHDEPRAAHVFAWDRHQAAALICYTVPGMRFFHEGQLDGRRVRNPVQLARRPDESLDRQTRRFYETLLRELQAPIFRRGTWKLLGAEPAWPGNDSWRDILAHSWCADGEDPRIVAVNYAPHHSQCHVPLDFSALPCSTAPLKDVFSGISVQRSVDSLRSPGFYLDMAPFQAHLFRVEDSR